MKARLAPVAEVVCAALAIVICAYLGRHMSWGLTDNRWMAEPYWPFYLTRPPAPVWSGRILLTALAACAAWVLARRWVQIDGAPTAAERTTLLVAVVVGAYLFHVGCGVQAHGLELGFRYTLMRGMEYWYDVKYVHAGFLAHFPEVGRLSVHGATHPPGLTLLLAGVQWLGFTDLHDAELLLSLAPALAAFPLYSAARRLADETTARWATVLFLFASSVVAFAVLAMDMWTMLFATCALYGFARALDGEWQGGVICGLALAATSLCNFIGLTLPATWVVLTIARRERVDRARVIAFATAVGAFAAFYVALWLVFDYRPFHVFAACRLAFRYSDNALRSKRAALVGNPVAFFGALGLPLMALAFRSTGGALLRLVRGVDAQTTALVIAAVLPGAVCTVTGHPRGEVEHVFLLYVPMLMIALAAAARRWYGRDAQWVSHLALPLLLTQSILIEIFLEPYW